MPETITFSLGTKWISQLVGQLATLRENRQRDLDEINNILGVDPLVLAPLYVEPFLQQLNPADFDEDEESGNVVRERMHKWASRFFDKPFKHHDGRNITFILSDAGMGKTSMLAMLKLADLALGSVSRSWSRKISFKLLKLGHESLEQIRGIKRSANTVLLLDALDEDKMSRGRIKDRLTELLNAVGPFRQVVITCRNQFFPREEREEIERQGRIVISGFKCNILYMSPFDDDQVDEYLRKIYPSILPKIIRRWFRVSESKELKAARRVVHSMRSLRMRPMLLSRIEDLVEETPVKGWSQFGVYEALIKKWLRREVQKLEGKISEEELWRASMWVAVKLQIEGDRHIGQEALLSQDGITSVMIECDFDGRSLFNSDSSGSYRFAHFSIQEFLVAWYIIVNSDNDAILAKLPRSVELINFLIFWFLDEPEGRVEILNVLVGGNNLTWGTELQYIDLHDANIASAALSGIRLSGANLRRTHLVRAHIEDATFDNVDLSGADLSVADLRKTVFNNSDLSNVNLDKSNLESVTFRNVVLSGARLCGSDLRDTVFDTVELLNVDARETDFRRSRLGTIRLQGADFTGSNFQALKLDGADFRGAILKSTRLQGAELRSANFHGVHLERADCSNADLRGTNFEQAILQNVEFFHADLQGANLQGANLQGANLQGANLQGANLQGANCSDCHLLGTLIQDAFLQDAILTQEQVDAASGNENTKLPEGIDMPAHWVKIADSPKFKF